MSKYATATAFLLLMALEGGCRSPYRTTASCGPGASARTDTAGNGQAESTPWTSQGLRALREPWREIPDPEQQQEVRAAILSILNAGREGVDATMRLRSMGVGTAGPLIEKIHEMDVAGRLETLDGFNRARLIDVALREITDLDHDVVFPEYYKTARQPPYSVMRVAITRWYAWWEAGALKEGSR